MGERFKECGLLFLVHADAGVLHVDQKVIDDLAYFVAEGNFDVAAIREFDGVSDEVDENLAEAGGVAEDAVGNGSGVVDGEGDALRRGAGAA